MQMIKLATAVNLATVAAGTALAIPDKTPFFGKREIVIEVVSQGVVTSGSTVQIQGQDGGTGGTWTTVATYTSAAGQDVKFTGTRYDYSRYNTTVGAGTGLIDVYLTAQS